MEASNSSPRPISEIWSLSKPEGRYNNWGERNWITAMPEKLNGIENELRTLSLSPRAAELYKAAKLTDSTGIEFVLFSNTQFSGPVNIDGGGLLVPCFLPFNPLNPQSEDRQAAMMKRGIFIYDGWIPIQDWAAEKIDGIVALLDNSVSIMSIVGKYHAFWEPKYIYSKTPVPSQLFYENDIQALSYSLNILDAVTPEDRVAISRSLAWMSNALRNAPVQRFLLLFVSIESLATYIESSKTKDDSFLKRIFADKQPTKSVMRQQREECIKKIQAETNDLTESVEKAYLECVQPSIRKKLEGHLDRVFGDKRVSAILFEERVEGKTLWQLRNDIAHGTVNMLNEANVRFIESRISTLEDIARGYLRIIFNTLVQKNYFSATRLPILTIPASQAIGSEQTQYMGPIDMAEYYLYVEALTSSHVQVSF